MSEQPEQFEIDPDEVDMADVAFEYDATNPSRCNSLSNGNVF